MFLVGWSTILFQNYGVYSIKMFLESNVKILKCICNVLSLYQVFYIKIIWTKKKIKLIEVLTFV